MKDLRQLAKLVKADAAGHYALAKSINVLNDGTYRHSPIDADFGGGFDGLGNVITDLRIKDRVNNSNVGLFASTQPQAVVAHVKLFEVRAIGPDATDGQVASVGALVGSNLGTVAYSYTERASITGGVGALVGGVVGYNVGTIIHGSSRGTVSGAAQTAVGGVAGKNSGLIYRSSAGGTVDGAGGYFAGGVTGDNRYGGIQESYATGTVSGSAIYNGGLEGADEGGATNSYSTATVTAGAGTYDGGFVGSTNGNINSSFSTGTVNAPGATFAGGFDGGQIGSFSNNYWDTQTSGYGEHNGCGEIQDCGGVTGLTTQQLQASLPAGFDPNIWGQTPNFNNGYPYLLANPPQ